VKNAEIKSLNLIVDTYIWQKICKLAKKQKTTPENMASFLIQKVQPTLKFCPEGSTNPATTPAT